MTKQELSHHGELKKQLSICREYAATLEAAARPGAQRLTGLPRVPGFRDKVGDLVVRIADTRAKVTRLERELYRSEAAITAYVATIPDSRTRIILQLRFVRGMGWKEIARFIGGGTTAACVERWARRFLAQISHSI